MKHDSIVADVPDDEVAPFTGAWIETRVENTIIDWSEKSHPSRVRGLKQTCISPRDLPEHVAPFTGAWIETRW